MKIQNFDSAWTVESDDDISKNLQRKAPSIRSNNSSLRSNNSSFYEEAMIINSVTNEKDPTLANLTLINGIKACFEKFQKVLEAFLNLIS